jgi:hypothetical protein
MRGRVLGVLVAAVMLAGVGSLARAAGSGSATVAQPLRLDATGWQHRAAASSLPAAADGIGPGSYLLITTTERDEFGAPTVFICTANFVWDGPWALDGSGGPYLGAAGHCFLPEDKDAYIGSNPYVTRVEVCVKDCAFGGQLGAAFTGELRDLGPVYYARQLRGDIDLGNDFGLVQIPASLIPLIRPAMPVWGGPAGSEAIGTGSPVCLYGNAGGLGEVFATKARAGLGVVEDDGAWFAVLPSFEGDSGSAVENCELSASGLSGTTAVGILTHLVVGTGDVAGTTVARAIEMVQQDWGRTITLRNG